VARKNSKRVVLLTYCRPEQPPLGKAVRRVVGQFASCKPAISTRRISAASSPTVPE